MAVTTESGLEVPEAVLVALEEVRESGVTNMIDIRGVRGRMVLDGHAQAAQFLHTHQGDYMDILNAFGEWLT